MTKVQQLQIKMSEAREKVNGMLDVRADDAEKLAERRKLLSEIQGMEVEYRAAIEAEADDTTTEPSAETRELTEIRDRVNVGAYVGAAIEGRGIAGGAELEYNQALGVPGDRFPMRLLEDRAAIDGDAASGQRPWVDRVFTDSAAARVGVGFQSVAPGTASVPVTTAGAAGAQRGRTQAAANAAYTVGVTELKPTRQAVHTIMSVEDNMRLPGLEDAIVRDLRGAVVDAVDKAVFLGDSTANENSADITGLQGTAGVTNVDITQANKITAPGVMAAFAGLIDGQYAGGFSDLRAVMSVGANKLWSSTIPNAATGNNQSIGQILAGNGLTWQVRGGIEADTTNGKYGAFVGLARGIAGAAVAAIWDAGSLIRDPYTDADTGEVRLTLNYLWAFGVPRAVNFKKVRFTT